MFDDIFTITQHHQQHFMNIIIGLIFEHFYKMLSVKFLYSLYLHILTDVVKWDFF